MKNCRFFLVVFLLVVVSIGGFACDTPERVEPPPPIEIYRSTAAAEHVEFEGVAADLRAALIHPDMLVRVERLGGLLQKLGPESAQQVLDVYETVWMELGQTELMLLADWWARFDPHAALEWAESDFRTARTNVPLAVFRSWARHDHLAAISRAVKGQKRNPKMRFAYETSAIEGWGESGQPGALEYIKGLGNGLDRQRALRGITRRKVMREGVAAAFEWADALPSDDKLFKLNTLRRVASAAGQQDPALAAQFVSKYDGTYYMRSLPQRVSMHWAKKDPLAAMRWLETLEPGRDQDEGVREGFRAWARIDRETAVAWAVSPPNSGWKDEAIALYARHIQVTDPKTGMEVSDNIVRESLRLLTMIIVARTWGAVEDPVAVAEWVKNYSGMTDIERERAGMIPEAHRRGLRTAIERYNGLDGRTALQRLEDDSDPDELEGLTQSERAKRLQPKFVHPMASK